MNPEIALLVTWLFSMLTATYVGYDRGRWAEALALGLVFGPFGLIAAGFLQPPARFKAAYEHAIRHEALLLRVRDRIERQRRKAERKSMEEWADVVSQQYEQSATAFDDQLQELAADLRDAGHGAPDRAKLARWSSWLQERMKSEQQSPR